MKTVNVSLVAALACLALSGGAFSQGAGGGGGTGGGSSGGGWHGDRRAQLGRCYCDGRQRAGRQHHEQFRYIYQDDAAPEGDTSQD